MIVKPLPTRRRPRRPVAVVTMASRGKVEVVTENGQILRRHRPQDCGRALRSLRGWVVYTTVPPSRLIATTGAEQWAARTWNGTVVRLRLDGGPVIYPLRDAFADTPGRLDRLGAVLTWLDWLDSLGVRPGSLSSMAWELWRATLDAPAVLRAPVGLGAFYGGRQELPTPGRYRKVRYWDIQAAYPAALTDDPYPRLLVPCPAQDWRTAPVGIARATVTVPRQPFGPLPFRVGRGTLCFGFGEGSGSWTFRELRMAAEFGCRVEVHEAWRGQGHERPFDNWRDIVAIGRRLPGAAGKLAKATSNVLWGLFAMTGAGKWVRWADEKRSYIVARDEYRPSPFMDTAYVAAETTARVRERLYREGLDLSDVIYADTDGVMLGHRTQPDPRYCGPDIGQWRIHRDMETVEVVAPQVYRWSCPECGGSHRRWHYTVAGANGPDAAERKFDLMHRTRSTSMLTSWGVTIPPADLDTIPERVKLRALAGIEHPAPQPSELRPKARR